MAAPTSTKKVSRAARTGGSRRRNSNASVGWYSILSIIVVIGVALVTFSRNERLDATSPGDTHPLAPVADPNNEAVPKRQGDHWYEAFGVYACDKFLPAINPGADPYGITTKNDGVIHIAPLQKKYAGHNATLGLFSKAVGIKLSRTSVQLQGDKAYKDGDKCGDKPAQFELKEWTSATDNNTGKQVKSDPSSLLLEDKHALVIALVPTGTAMKDIPLPPSASKLAEAAATDASAGSQSGAPSSSPTPSGNAAPSAPVTSSPTPAGNAPQSVPPGTQPSPVATTPATAPSK